MPVGLAIGVASQLVLVPLIYWPIFWLIGDQDVSAAARELTDRATDPFGVVLLFLIVGIGAPIAEEIFFRGLHPAVARAPVRAAWWPWSCTAAFFARHPLRAAAVPGAVRLRPGARLAGPRAPAGSGTSIWAHLGFNLVAAATLGVELSCHVCALVAIALLGLAACGYLVATMAGGAR